MPPARVVSSSLRRDVSGGSVENGNSGNSAMERPKDQTRLKIERMEAEREERRRAMLERKQERAEEEQRNIAAGNPGDVDFIGMVRRFRAEHAGEARPHASTGRDHPKICICVRKRPVSDKERNKRDHDSITCLHPAVWVHSAKFKVDGITKYLDHNEFYFDHAFDENTSTEDVYIHSTMPLVEFVVGGKGGRATVFAYGQTGSGKTFTMNGIQNMVAEDLFALLDKETDGYDVSAESKNSPTKQPCSTNDTVVTVAFFEIYGGVIQDLLSNNRRLKLLEDGKGEVVISGLEEYEATGPEQMLSLIETGNRRRTTHATEANDTSSRSHAICQVLLRDKSSNRLRGKISLVDLAGSERGTDTKSHNRQRRTESSEINTSLLALKECIRALDASARSYAVASRHVPYRASKLTLILKDCFTSKLARTTMIATVSPGASSADHTINTLRYADRIKEKKKGRLSMRGNSDCVARSRPSANTTSGGSNALDCAAAPKSSSDLSDDFDQEYDYAEEEKCHDNYGEHILHQETEDDDEETEKRPARVEEPKELTELRQTVQKLLEEEEALLNSHMSVIQENAELLTEEGKLISSVQRGDVTDEEIDQYASRLGAILDRKTHLIMMLQKKLGSFRDHVKKEEELSRKLGNIPDEV